MNFFKTFIGVCSGTAIFVHLLRHSAFKAFRHLLYMATLCAIGITIAGMIAIVPKIDIASDIVAEHCGDIVFAKGRGVIPSREPDKAKLFFLPGNISVCYIPDSYQGKPPMFDENEVSFGIFWLSDNIAVWYKNSDGQMFLRSGLSQEEIDRENIINVLRANRPGFNTATFPEQNISRDELQSLAVWLAGISLFLGFLWQALFQSLLFIIVFSLIFTFLGNRKMQSLRFRDLFVSGIYAALPAMTVASFFPAFDLPLLNYHSAFFIGLTGYLLVVINRLELELKSDSAAPSE